MTLETTPIGAMPYQAEKQGLAKKNKVSFGSQPSDGRSYRGPDPLVAALPAAGAVLGGAIPLATFKKPQFTSPEAQLLAAKNPEAFGLSESAKKALDEGKFTVGTKEVEGAKKALTQATGQVESKAKDLLGKTRLVKAFGPKPSSELKSFLDGLAKKAVSDGTSGEDLLKQLSTDIIEEANKDKSKLGKEIRTALKGKQNKKSPLRVIFELQNGKLSIKENANPTVLLSNKKLKVIDPEGTLKAFDDTQKVVDNLVDQVGKHMPKIPGPGRVATGLVVGTVLGGLAAAGLAGRGNNNRA